MNSRKTPEFFDGEVLKWRKVPGLAIGEIRYPPVAAGRNMATNTPASIFCFRAVTPSIKNSFARVQDSEPVLPAKRT